MKNTLSYAQAKTLLENRLLHFFGVSVEQASMEQFYRAIAMTLNDIMLEKRADFKKRADKADAKRVYYLSMEFLMGRSLKNNLYNLGLTETYRKLLKEYGISLDSVYECEPDAGLGNGGLGRLAACYLDGLASDGYPARGYSLLYEYGIFRQKIVDGWQTELPDNWLPGGDVWLIRRPESAVDVTFEGTVKDSWVDGRHNVEVVGGDVIKAIPSDMFVAGKDGKGISVLRLWTADAPGFNMTDFADGNYIKAGEKQALAKAITQVLYPADNHPEGKALRLRQQYFLVSASIQDILHHHLNEYHTLDNLAEKMAIHINDTHPTLAIPELMRILLDECGYGWDDAWNIVGKTIAYTNHTVMAEALECWREDLVKRLLPRIYEIIKEIDNRFRASVWNTSYDAGLVERTAVISGGVVRMANLCVASCHSVNGVSALHSDLLKKTVFKDFYGIMPEKFTNVTNGIAHRRWLCQANPALTDYLTEIIGKGFIADGRELSKLRAFADDEAVLAELAKIKQKNKEDFAKYIYKKTGEVIDPNSMFDAQVKRLHEYKRQELNALQILSRYIEIKENPNGNWLPHTWIFGAKAAPGYIMAKNIISFIIGLRDMINADPVASKFMKIVYVEDYCVTAAERLMPACDISEQISLAGTEASGTGNMKLMINGAVTLGTMDGANIEIYENVGEDNIIIFGMTTPEVDALKAAGYNPGAYYENNPVLHNTIDFINNNRIAGKNFPEIGQTIKHHDPYMVLADFADYRLKQQRAEELYVSGTPFRKMSLQNIAGAGFFAADRAIEEYATNIWHTNKAADK